MKRKHVLVATALFFLVAVSFLALRSNSHKSRFRTFPSVTLWAWEQPEDLRGLDSRRFAVAYLDQTIILTNTVDLVPRRQPLLISPEVKLIAVVRIDARAGTADLSDPSLPKKIAAIITQSFPDRSPSALQIDFDARKSQRAFYTALLQEVRRELPANIPLSVTALASWCAFDDWIGKLPIDEAVPMFFRMGPDHPPSDLPGWNYPIREPLCRGVAGVSTDEAWPKLKSDTRLYIFHPRAWNSIALSNLESDFPR